MGIKKEAALSRLFFFPLRTNALLRACQEIVFHIPDG